MKMICVTIAVMCVLLCRQSFAHFRIQPQSEQVPAEAWRRMDTHSQIDPQVLRLQQEQAEAQKKAQILNAKKVQYSHLLWQRVNLNSALRGLNGYPQVGITAAVADAAHYMALRDVERQATATSWLSARMSNIEELLRQEKNPNLLAAAHDTIIASALAGRSSQMKAPQGTGQAAGTSKASNSMATATEYHNAVLRYLTQ